MAHNPWTEASRIIQERMITDMLPLNAGLEQMTWTALGDPGVMKYSQQRVKKLGNLDVSVLFHVPNPQKLTFEGRDLYTMWMGMDVEIGWEEAAQIARMGALIDGMDRILESGVVDVTKTIWGGTTEALNGHAIDGLRAAGSGTFASPSIIDAGSSAGKWDAAGKAALDINTLHSKLRKKTNGPLALFVPLSALELVNYPVPTSATAFGEKDIIDLIDAKFDAVIFTGDDPLTGYNLVTGAAETSENCQLYAADISTLNIVYQKDLALETLPWDTDKRSGKIRYDGKLGWYASPVETSSTVYQKMICEIDAIDLTT
jgi:hypothetical protein